MREQLLAIFESMKKVETKGDSTVIMADCLRALVGVINSMSDEKEGEETK